MNKIILARLTDDDREQFISDNQEAFNFGALKEFGRRDDHFEEDGEIISRETIDKSIDGGEAYRIMKSKTKFIFSALCGALVVLLIVFVRRIDVRQIGPENTSIGLSHLNG